MRGDYVRDRLHNLRLRAVATLEASIGVVAVVAEWFEPVLETIDLFNIVT